MKKFLVLLLVLAGALAHAQDSTNAVIVVIPQKADYIPSFPDSTDEDFGTFHRKGFMLAVNGMYDLEFNDGKRYRSARILSIDESTQTFRITSCFSPTYARMHQCKYDTVQYAVSDICCLRLLADMELNICRRVQCSHFKFQALSAPRHCCIPAPYDNSKRADTMQAYYYLTTSGWQILFEEQGQLYFLM